MTTGEKLKKDLGLSKFSYVTMTRALVTSYPIYMIFFDSRWPNTPLTSQRVLKAPMPSMIYSYPFNKPPTLTPMFSIEDYNGTVTMGLFFVIDISGYMGQPNLRENKLAIYEKTHYLYSKSLEKILESLTISDLKANAVSDRNKSFLKIRRSDGESGSKLDNVKWDDDSNTITLDWVVTPTYSTDVVNYTPELDAYKDSKYAVQIQFQEVSKFLGDKKTYKEFTPQEQGKLVLDMLNNGEVKLWSSDPSFLFQSSFEYLDQVDASIFPYNGPKGKNIWANKHTGTSIPGLHLTKHTNEILQYINNSYSVIAKALRES